MSSVNEDFEQKINRLRQTGVGGVEISSGTHSSQDRKGDMASIKMRVEKGWAVAGVVNKNKPSQSEKKEIRNDGNIKVFSIKNIEQPKANPVIEQQDDTEESIIKQIIELQKRLAKVRNK